MNRVLSSVSKMAIVVAPAFFSGMALLLGFLAVQFRISTAKEQRSKDDKQRRERLAGEWSDVATAMESEITLNGQTRSKEFEFRVLAANKVGDGEASNSVIAVL